MLLANAVEAPEPMKLLGAALDQMKCQATEREQASALERTDRQPARGSGLPSNGHIAPSFKMDDGRYPRARHLEAYVASNVRAFGG